MTHDMDGFDRQQKVNGLGFIKDLHRFSVRDFIAFQVKLTYICVLCEKEQTRSASFRTVKTSGAWVR